MSASSTLNITHAQLGKLLQLLQEYEQHFLSDQSNTDVERIYFVDSDVMSAFVEGKPRDPIDNWPSLISLDHTASRNATVSDDANALATSLAQSLGRFIFGQFNKSLDAQRGRYYLTPEHHRELKSITYAVVREARESDPNLNGWLDRLEAAYVRLGGGGLQASTADEQVLNIANLLAESAAFGKVARTHALHRDFTVNFGNHMITPNRGRPFIYEASTASEESVVRALAKSGFEIFRALYKNRGAEKYFDIKRAVFEFHGPGKSLTQFVNHILSNHELRNAHELSSLAATDVLLSEHAYRAAKEVADIFSLARMTQLATQLNRTRRTTSNNRWEVCFVSGSTTVANLHALWRNQDEALNSVRIVHPLSFLRHPALFDPDGVEKIEDSIGERPDEEYAFRVMRNDKASRLDQVDIPRFCVSLQRMLAGVTTRASERDDRSLQSLRWRLRHAEDFSLDRYVAAVRQAIANSFLDAYIQINALESPRAGNLSVGSIPMLTLPMDKSGSKISEADRLFERIYQAGAPDGSASTFGQLWENLRRRVTGLPNEDDLLEPIRKEDVTGYSAMLCATVLYLMRGKQWIRAAETMASTAAMLALGAKIERYPHGNEALYLKAFLQRMSLSVDESAPSEWLRHHALLVSQAVDALSRWRTDEPSHASEPISKLENSVNRYDVIKLRCDAESVAGRVFVLFLELVRVSDANNAVIESHGAVPSISNPVELCFDSEVKVATLLNDVVNLANNAIQMTESIVTAYSAHRPHSDFALSQMWAMALQAWLYTSESRAELVLISRSRLEALALSQIPSLMKHFCNRSKLLCILAEIFLIRLGERTSVFGVSKADFKKLSFANIDIQRSTYLEKQWRIVKGGAPVHSDAPKLQ